MGAFHSNPPLSQALELPDDGTGDLAVLKNLGTAWTPTANIRSAWPFCVRQPSTPHCPPNVVLLLGRLLAKINPKETLSLLSSRAAVVQDSPELLALQADCLATHNELEPALVDLMQACDLAPDHPTS